MGIRPDLGFMEDELTDWGPPFSRLRGALISAVVKPLNGTPSLRGIFIDRFRTPFQPAAAAFIAAVVRPLDGETVASENIW